MTEDRRTRLAEAGLSALAIAGARGLTHRAVDRAAGIAQGSTSYYFRTRSALLQACAEQLIVRTMRAIGPLALPEPLTVDDLIGLAVEAVFSWTADGGRLILARHELLLESARYPDLRRSIASLGERVHALVEQRVQELGLPDAKERAVDLIACLDGLALAHAVVGTVERDVMARSVSRVISGLLR